MTPEAFVSSLSKVHLPSVFNPYADKCSSYDKRDAAVLRRQNLEAIISAATRDGVSAIWVARDLGYRGGRRTGIPLTDEVHIGDMSRIFGGIKLARATTGDVVAERTAAVIWKVIARLKQPIFLWNVFPFHPHEEGNPFSNRCHSRSERELTLPFLDTLILMLKPKRLVAIGKDAQSALSAMNIPVSTVRHPSYGGQAEFMAGIGELYGLGNDIAEDLPLLNIRLDRDQLSGSGLLARR